MLTKMCELGRVRTLRKITLAQYSSTKLRGQSVLELQAWVTNTFESVRLWNFFIVWSKLVRFWGINVGNQLKVLSISIEEALLN